MASWKSLNPKEEALLRERGIEPEGMVVNRVGADAFVFLRLKTREEIYISLYRREDPYGRKKNAGAVRV